MKDLHTTISLPEVDPSKTVCSHDIETRAIQILILNILNKVEGVCLLATNLIDTLLGREAERLKGIFVEQDPKTHTLKIRIEVNMHYGISIPEKVKEVHRRILQEVEEFMQLPVAHIHVVVKGLVNTTPQDDCSPAYTSLLEDEEVFEQECPPVL